MFNLKKIKTRNKPQFFVFFLRFILKTQEPKFESLSKLKFHQQINWSVKNICLVERAILLNYSIFIYGYQT